MKYVVYATTEHGRGYVMKIGEYDDISKMEIHIGHFSDDVRIMVEEEQKEEE